MAFQNSNLGLVDLPCQNKSKFMPNFWNLSISIGICVKNWLGKSIKMVFLHFPSKLTEEELMLQAKYAKLRKKKKQVAAHQNPSKASEAEKSILSSSQNRYFRDYPKIQPNLTLKCYVGVKEQNFWLLLSHSHPDSPSRVMLR